MVAWLVTLSLRRARTSQQWEHAKERTANFIVARKKRDGGGENRQNYESMIHQLIDP